jgi:hypothetical protein
MAQQHQYAFDANRDGAVTRAEWQGDPVKFNRMDTDGNGVLSQREFFNPGEWQPAAAPAAQAGASSGEGDDSLEQLLLRLFSQ